MAKRQSKAKTPSTQIKYLCSLWGMHLPTLEANLRLIKEAGFDGVEMAAPADLDKRGDLRALLDELQLDLVVQQHSRGDTPDEQTKSLLQQLEWGAELRPLLINSHTGKDFFALKENLRIIKKVTQRAAKLDLPIVHEMHRTRAPYTAPVTMAILDALPDLRITADFSHWCVVHESLMQDQPEAMARAIAHTWHIHARVGFAEAAQVNDPRAPEWQAALDAHLDWWQRVVDARRADGAPLLTVATEFGPPNYLPTLPYTRQPVANLWEINCWMMRLLRERFAQ